jgi:hypothetical protein
MTMNIQLSLDGRSALLHDAQTGTLLGQIAAGHQSMTEQHFQRRPLDALALERAIEWTEDRIQQAGLHIPAGSRLFTQDAQVRLLAQAAGLQEAVPVLHVSAVEQLFSRLVLQAFGQSPHQQELPDDPQVFSTVVLLREMLHHLRFEHITVGPASGATVQNKL